MKLAFHRAARLLACGVLTAIAASCAQQPGAPIIDRSDGRDAAQAPSPAAKPRPTTRRGEFYTIRAADTLYGIAWRHDLDYKALAAANDIAPPYTVYPGQRIRLLEARPPRPLPAEPRTTPRPRSAAATPAPETSPPTATPRPSPQQAAQPPPPPPPANASGWRRPVRGKPVRTFGGTSKGIDYELPANTPVYAASAGEVVYAGPGLGGYRHLLIVKASERHLVAYGVNVQPNPAEGDRITAGTTIATIPGGDAATGRFHFEIRDNGKPVNPASLIGGL